MRVYAALLVLAMGCGKNFTAPPDVMADADNSTPFDQCGADPATFVRQSFLALDGRRPKSQAEVDVYVDLYNAAGMQSLDPKDTVARAIMNNPEFDEHWVDVVMDAMHVQRVDIQTEAACWETALRPTVDAMLATSIRGARATTTGDGQPFSMLDLARSALVLDDLTPIYRAELFSLVDHPIPAANVAPVQAELARREDFGATFDSAYLHRNIVCLGCHNSEHSVTDNDDPAKDRFWPVPGLPEKGVYGMSNGVDVTRAHGVFRVDGFVENGTTRPWSWTPECGSFAPPAGIPADPASIDTKLASITGAKPTVFDLEAALGRGFEALRGNPLVVGTDGAIADPDTALAWLVTLKITEDIWQQATGTTLTIANYFPRNEAASDLLDQLATKFIVSGYSLKALLSAIVATNYFDRLPAEAACGSGPYTYPNVYDPWVISDSDPAKRLNGPGDAVTAVDARTLVTAANAALSWPLPPGATRFPDYGEPGCETETCAQLPSDCGFGQCCTTYHTVCQMGGVSPAVALAFDRGVGVFLRNSERGFRGIDFQARLVWENQYGACARPAWVTTDLIDGLMTAGMADPTATVGDVVSALKDRLVGEPAVAAGPETDAVVAIVGPLASPVSSLQPANVRRLCGALLGSPQFLLQGIAGHGGARPKLTPADAGYDAICAGLATQGLGVPGKAVTCAAGTLTLGAGSARMQPKTLPTKQLQPHGMPPRRIPAPLAHRLQR
jgi:hypothetical protein